MKWLICACVLTAVGVAGWMPGCVNDVPAAPDPHVAPSGADLLDECRNEWHRQDDLMADIEAAVADLPDVITRPDVVAKDGAQ